jgi:hypothetical protein
MDDQQILMETDLELRVRRLEQLHIWGMTIVLFGIIGYFSFQHLQKK